MSDRLSADTLILHGSLVARRMDGIWQGALLTGPSGSGKSDLALRLAAGGWRLVSDDRTVVWRDGDHLYGRTPPALAGLVELRGQGVFATPVLPGFARIRLVVDCVRPDQPLERMPELRTIEILRGVLPRVQLVALEASAVHRLDLVLALA